LPRPVFSLLRFGSVRATGTTPLPIFFDDLRSLFLILFVCFTGMRFFSSPVPASVSQHLLSEFVFLYGQGLVSTCEAVRLHFSPGFFFFLVLVDSCTFDGLLQAAEPSGGENFYSVAAFKPPPLSQGRLSLVRWASFSSFIHLG